MINYSNLFYQYPPHFLPPRVCPDSPRLRRGSVARTHARARERESVCVCVTYLSSVFNSILVALFLLLRRLLKSPLPCTFSFPCYTSMPLSPLLHTDVAAALSLIAVLLHLLFSDTPSSTQPSSLRIPSLWGTYPCYGAISAISAPSSIFGIYWMYASLSLAPWRRRVLDLTIDSDI